MQKLCVGYPELLQELSEYENSIMRLLFIITPPSIYNSLSYLFPLHDLNVALFSGFGNV